MAEFGLNEIYQALVAASEARDEAMEALNEALSDLRVANRKYDAAVSDFAEYLGNTETSEGVDMGDIFTTISGGGKGLVGFNPSKIFGDLF